MAGGRLKPDEYFNLSHETYHDLLLFLRFLGFSWEYISQCTGRSVATCRFTHSRLKARRAELRSKLAMLVVHCKMQGLLNAHTQPPDFLALVRDAFGIAQDVSVPWPPATKPRLKMTWPRRPASPGNSPK